MGALLSVTQAPPSTVGRAVVAAVALVARLRPIIATRPLGAMDGRKFAAFTTPLLLTAGAAVAVASNGIPLGADGVKTKEFVPDASTAIAGPRIFTRWPGGGRVAGASSPALDARV